METKTYNDGDEVENYLLSLFKQGISKNEIDKILNDDPSWPVKYHLSDERHNLLSWYNFDKESSILEIGAGCGALTGLFLEKDLDVTAIELSSRRAEIIKERFKKRKNLTVFDGNINEKEFQNKFDYVTLIGVLEYAGIYGEGENPFLDLLKKAKGYLKKKGVLIIAIENRFGLKYWRGSSEDHTDRLFDSLEGYPMCSGIRTFGKEEIKSLSKKTGFTEDTISFYYPIPDYKFCYEIFSDKYLPTSTHQVSNNLFPSPHPSTNYHLFNEKLVSQGLQENSLFDFFANSFLIFLTNE